MGHFKVKKVHMTQPECSKDHQQPSRDTFDEIEIFLKGGLTVALWAMLTLPKV